MRYNCQYEHRMIRYICMKDRTEYRKKYYAEHREESLAKSKQWQENNRERLREYNRKYHEEHKKEISERKKKYYQENLQEMRRRGREQREKHKEKRLAHEKEYRRAHADERYAKAKKYRREKTGFAVAKVHDAIIRGKITKEVCEVCGAEQAEAHHDDYNKPLEVRWLCKKCHTEWHLAHTPKYLGEE